MGCSGYRIKHGTSDAAIVKAIREYAAKSAAETEDSPWITATDLTDDQLLAVIGWSVLAKTACAQGSPAPERHERLTEPGRRLHLSGSGRRHTPAFRVSQDAVLRRQATPNGAQILTAGLAVAGLKSRTFAPPAPMAGSQTGSQHQELSGGAEPCQVNVVPGQRHAGRR
jgi:hypothetical protein